MTVNVEAGTKKFCYLRVTGAAAERTFVSNPLLGPPRPTTSRIPVMYVKGSVEGPNLCIVGGTHACEYPSIEAAIQIYKQTDPLQLKGQLVIVPVVNTAGFWTRTPYVNPSDGIDIGATYGVAGTSISYRIGRVLVDEVFSHADYILDLHGGDVMEDIVPHAGYTKIGDKKVDEGSEMLAKVFGTEYVFERLVPGAFEKSGLRIPRTLAEAGREGKLEEQYTAMHTKGITNVMKALGMIPGDPNLPPRQIIMHGRYEVFANESGLFYPQVQLGDHVREGDTLAEIRGIDGAILEEIGAPKDGMVMLTMTNPVKHRNDLLFKCWMP